MGDTILHPGWETFWSLSHALGLIGPQEGAVHRRGSRPGKGVWAKTASLSVGLGSASYWQDTHCSAGSHARLRTSYNLACVLLNAIIP